MDIANTIKKIERHCNNYFNPKNDPNDPRRDHPPEFLELAEQINDFMNSRSGQANIIVRQGGIFGGISNNYFYEKATTPDGVPVRWQSIFAKDLQVYKRAKFI